MAGMAMGLKMFRMRCGGSSRLWKISPRDTIKVRRSRRVHGSCLCSGLDSVRSRPLGRIVRLYTRVKLKRHTYVNNVCIY